MFHKHLLAGALCIGLVYPEAFWVEIENKGGRPVEKASVALPGKGLALATAKKGIFQFPERPEIDEVIVITQPGFATETRSMKDFSATNAMRVVMAPHRHRRLGEVTVRGEGREGAEKTAAREDLRRSAQLNWGDAARTLQSLPGVVSSGNSFDSRMYIQGGSDLEWVGMLDHVVLFNPVRWNGAVSMFNPKILEQVSLSMAGYPALYGQGLSGVLVAQTLEPSRSGWHGNLSFDAGFEGLLTGPLGSKGSILLCARRTWLDAVINLGKSDPNFKFPFIADGLLKIQWYPFSKTTLAFTAYGSLEGMDMKSGPGFPSRSVNETNDSTQFDYRDLNLIGSLLWKQGFGAKSDFSLSLSVLPRLNSNALSGSSLSDFDIQTSGLSWQGSFVLNVGDWDGHSWSLGALVVPHEARVELENKMGYINGAGLWTNETLRVTNDTRDLFTRFFVQDAWRPLPQVTITPGFGAAWLRRTGEWVYEPRGDLTWKPSKVFTGFVRGGLYHQQEMDSLTLRRPPSPLAAPRAEHLSAGFQILGGGWLFSGEAFYKNYQGLLVAAPNLGLTNTGERQVWGASVFLRHRRQEGGALGGFLSYTWTQAEERVGGRVSGMAFEALPEVGQVYAPGFIRAHSLSASLEVLPFHGFSKWPAVLRLLEILVDGRLQSGNPTTTVTNVMRLEIPGVGYRYQLLYGAYNQGQNPALAGIDLKIAFPIKKNIRTFFTAVNLLGASKIIDTVYQVQDTPPMGAPVIYQATVLGPGAVKAVAVKDQDGAIQFRGGVSFDF